MTELAYILIETNVGKTREVVNAMRGVKGVLSVDAVTGPYDIIVKMEGKTLADIGNVVVADIHPIGGISRTVTCLA
ncbi:MAG: Lrp/AsnC ligand binding domain-containing protein, partial [Candidatus Thorarchaeota archaeon]